MQYTPASFSDSLMQISQPMSGVRRKFEDIPSTEIFPKARNYQLERHDFLEEEGVMKPFRGLKFYLKQSSHFQTGLIQHYVLYGFLYLILFFLLTFFEILK